MTSQNIASLLIYLRNTLYYLIFVSAANRYITIREVFLEKLLKRNNIISKIVLFFFLFVLCFRNYCEIIIREVCLSKVQEKKFKYISSVGILELSTPMFDDNYQIFFEVTNKFLIVFLPVVILFSFCLYNVVGKIFKKISTIWYISIPLLGISIFFYFSPAIMLIFSILVSGFMLNLTYSTFFEKWLSSKMSSSNLLSYLNEVGILSFFFRLFSSVFCVSTSNQFMLILWSSHILSFLYVLFSRYFIFFTFVIVLPFPKIISILLLSAIFMCLVALLFRFFINISLGIVFTTMSIKPSLWENFLLTEPLFDPVKNPPNVPSNNNGGFIPPRISAWKIAGYGIGFCTLGVSCFIAYHTYGSHMESRKQTAIAGEANRLKRYELAKANPKDIDVIFAGFPEEKESYQQRRK